MYAGISGGVFAVMAYTGFTNIDVVGDLFRDNKRDIGTIEWFYCTLCLCSTLVLPLYETVMLGFNSGHAIGILLGILTGYVEEIGSPDSELSDSQPRP